MKRFALGISAATLAAIFFTAPTHAATYNIVFDGTFFDVTAQISTDAFDNVTAISGNVSGPYAGGPISNLVSLGDPLQGTVWNFDNIFAGLTPFVTNGGILFQTGGTGGFNLYSVGALIYLSVGNPTVNELDYNPGDLGTLDVAEVPLPAALPLLAAALGAFGFLGRSRRARTALTRTA